MAMLTVRNLPAEVHRALRVRAAQHGHSMEAEVREILESTLAPEGPFVWKLQRIDRLKLRLTQL